MSKQHSAQVKQETVHYVNSHPEKSIKAISVELNISYSSLKTWCREACYAQTPTALSARSLKELEKENTQLNKELVMREKEIDILKKFSVYLAKLQL